MNPKDAIIADINPELINMYQQISDNPKKVIKILKKHKNNKEYFLKIRAQDRKELTPAEASARMIYLNRTCFN